MSLRVISGAAKGRHLRSVPGDLTRPITDRVKQALFNIVGADVVDSAWWDVFAGTGAVGIEALSRGAAFTRFTDLHRDPIETIRANLETTHLSARAEVKRADSFALLAAIPDRQFHYIFIAPPQYQGDWSKALTILDRNANWLAPDGWALVQIAPKEYHQWQGTLAEIEQRKYGTTLLVFYSRKE
jgi:16S rRNA (guanine(966)-N(2))-methyltransferase RsmD